MNIFEQISCVLSMAQYIHTRLLENGLAEVDLFHEPMYYAPSFHNGMVQVGDFTISLSEPHQMLLPLEYTRPNSEFFRNTIMALEDIVSDITAKNKIIVVGNPINQSYIGLN